MFRFTEVKYRRHLRTARSPDALQGVRQQVESLRQRWDELVRQRRRVLIFPSSPAGKARPSAAILRRQGATTCKLRRRLGLSAEAYNTLAAEIDRLIEKGGGVLVRQSIEYPDRGLGVLSGVRRQQTTRHHTGGLGNADLPLRPRFQLSSGLCRPTSICEGSTAPPPVVPLEKNESTDGFRTQHCTKHQCESSDGAGNVPMVEERSRRGRKSLSESTAQRVLTMHRLSLPWYRPAHRHGSTVAADHQGQSSSAWWPVCLAWARQPVC